MRFMMRLIPTGYETAAPGTTPEAAAATIGFADFSPDLQPAPAGFAEVQVQARQRSGA